eukprot:6021368-Amphidinium_carterae.1
MGAVEVRLAGCLPWPNFAAVARLGWSGRAALNLAANNPFVCMPSATKTDKQNSLHDLSYIVGLAYHPIILQLLHAYTRTDIDVIFDAKAGQTVKDGDEKRLESDHPQGRFDLLCAKNSNN